MLNQKVLIRIIFHLLLAVFLANAANKFFIPNLEHELAHGFYQKIFEFRGEAPDQYRILPLLGLKVLNQFFPFNHAVLAFNFLAGFLCFELIYYLLGPLSRLKKLGFNVLLAGSYIYLQYTGWRPDTLGLLLLCLLVVLALKVKAAAPKWVLLYLGVIALAFSRADIALVYAVFLAIYGGNRIWIRLPLILIPPAVQLLLQFYIFPEADYYTKPVMILDNLSLFYLVRNPASWLILALILGFWSRIWEFFRQTYPQFKFLYFLLAFYFLLVFAVGRVNEYRLYMPFIPLFIWVWQRTTIGNGEKTGSI